MGGALVGFHHSSSLFHSGISVHVPTQCVLSHVLRGSSVVLNYSSVGCTFSPSYFSSLCGNVYMSRNVRTRSQLLSVYYPQSPCHARELNVLSYMGINFQSYPEAKL